MPKLKDRKLYSPPRSLKDKLFHFCPGCHHGLAHQLVARAIDDLNLAKRAVGVIGVGCGVFLYDYINIDCCEAPHGRAPAVATGIKRADPELAVFTYQGDGDLAAIGTSEILHAANRKENITIIFINNSIYGMTGGQMAPTTLPGQKTTTTPSGRSTDKEGFPLKMAELLATFEGTAFSARASLHNAREIKKAENAVKRAFLAQLNNKGMGIVELLSACPTNWQLSPEESLKQITNSMIPNFPLGIIKDTI